MESFYSCITVGNFSGNAINQVTDHRSSFTQTIFSAWFRILRLDINSFSGGGIVPAIVF